MYYILICDEYINVYNKDSLNKGCNLQRNNF